MVRRAAVTPVLVGLAPRPRAPEHRRSAYRCVIGVFALLGASGCLSFVIAGEPTPPPPAPISCRTLDYAPPVLDALIAVAAGIAYVALPRSNSDCNTPTGEGCEAGALDKVARAALVVTVPVGLISSTVGFVQVAGCPARRRERERLLTSP